MFSGLVDLLRRDLRLRHFSLYLRGGFFRRLQVFHQRGIAQYVIFEITTIRLNVLVNPRNYTKLHYLHYINERKSLNMQTQNMQAHIKEGVGVQPPPPPEILGKLFDVFKNIET